MQNLNPTRIVQRRGREVMIIGAFVLMFGLLSCGCSLVAFLLFSNSVFGYGLVALGGLIILVGIGFMVRGLTFRLENQPALAVADVLGRELDSRFWLSRNVSRAGLGYMA